MNPCNMELNALTEVDKAIPSASREMHAYPTKRRNSIIRFATRLQKGLRKLLCF